MKLRIVSACALAACVCGVAGARASASASLPASAGQEAKAQETKVSDGERQAAEKINKAAGPEAKLQAASEFLKKYPKSSLRPKVGEAVLAAIETATDNQLKISLAEAYLSIFKEPGEGDPVNPILLNAYIDAEKAEDAFRLGGAWLAKNPDDVDTLKRLAILASNESIRNNNNFIRQGQEHGAKAIALIEADKMPATLDAARWASYKADALPALYRATGIMSLRSNDKTGARTQLEKAAALKINDPAVYLILSDFVNEDYTTMAQKHRSMPEGAEKQAYLKTVEAELDKVIDAFARAVAATDGNAQYQQANAQIRQDLENYYKFRHNNSTDGLQQLIDKHKKPATP